MSNCARAALEIESRVSSAKRDAALVQAGQDFSQQREDLISTLKTGIDSANTLKVAEGKPTDVLSPELEGLWI